MDDASAIRQCRAGDKEAFRHLVEHYQAEAIGHAISILGSREDALDAVQEAFIDAYQALDRFDPSRKFYPWFYIILRHRCYKLAAGRKRREMSSTSESVVLELSAGTRPPEETMLLERALLDLAEDERELISLRHLDGLSYEELAERLEVPLGTVMSRLFHTRKNLRKNLVRHSFPGFSKE